LGDILCLQAYPKGSGTPDGTTQGNSTETEDCLFLDVYTTKSAFEHRKGNPDSTNDPVRGAAHAPVIVWFHSGK